MTPFLRNFNACRTKVSDGKFLIDVSGEVQLLGIDGLASLILMDPQGILPATLMIEIKATKIRGSVGVSQFRQHVCWAKECSFEHDLIDLFWNGNLVHSIPILES